MKKCFWVMYSWSSIYWFFDVQKTPTRTAGGMWNPLHRDPRWSKNFEPRDLLIAAFSAPNIDEP